MKSAVVLMTLGALCSPGFAWIFGGSGRQQAEGPIQQSCIELARKGDCHFYTCFDERHPCSEHNYALSYGWRYCVRYDQNYQQLTVQGKNWVNSTRKCSMEKMLEFYEDSHINCEDVQEEMKNNHGRCEAEFGICDSNLLSENKEVFRSVYGVSKKTLLRFLFSIKHCGLSTLREVAAWFDDLDLDFDFDSIKEAIEGHWDGLQETLGDAFEDIRDNFDDFDFGDIGDFFRQIHPGAHP